MQGTAIPDSLFASDNSAMMYNAPKYLERMMSDLASFSQFLDEIHNLEQNPVYIALANYLQIENGERNAFSPDYLAFFKLKTGISASGATEMAEYYGVSVNELCFFFWKIYRNYVVFEERKEHENPTYEQVLQTTQDFLNTVTRIYLELPDFQLFMAQEFVELRIPTSVRRGLYNKLSALLGTKWMKELESESFEEIFWNLVSERNIEVMLEPVKEVGDTPRSAIVLEVREVVGSIRYIKIPYPEKAKFDEGKYAAMTLPKWDGTRLRNILIEVFGKNWASLLEPGQTLAELFWTMVADKKIQLLISEKVDWTKSSFTYRES